MHVSSKTALFELLGIQISVASRMPPFLLYGSITPLQGFIRRGRDGVLITRETNAGVLRELRCLGGTPVPPIGWGPSLTIICRVLLWDPAVDY